MSEPISECVRCGETSGVRGDICGWCARGEVEQLLELERKRLAMAEKKIRSHELHYDRMADTGAAWEMYLSGRWVVSVTFVAALDAAIAEERS